MRFTAPVESRCAIPPWPVKRSRLYIVGIWAAGCQVYSGRHIHPSACARSHGHLSIRGYDAARFALFASRAAIAEADQPPEEGLAAGRVHRLGHPGTVLTLRGRVAEYNPAEVMMTLPQNGRFDLTSGLPICRILNGMWQVSGAHGAIDPDAAISSMFDYVDAGLTTWDLADHYGPAEDFVGEFRRRLASARGGEAVSGIQTFTKWVPRPGPMTRQVVENNIDISRRRMGMDRLDLLQFHWWDYRDSAYLEALTHLSDLRDEGMIQELALTNFDTQRMQEIAGQGIRVVSNQVPVFPGRPSPRSRNGRVLPVA